MQFSWTGFLGDQKNNYPVIPVNPVKVLPLGI
jgi:hypothetical protein